ncbi:AAA family ATPase [Streptomyces cyaneofuscatus]|uniref:AAA family ATPase n=1 Tax=Streptomyces cyaneofuscatus TaxID=66883 RepID=UPI0033B8660E
MIKLYLEERDDIRGRLHILLDKSRKFKGSIAVVSGPTAAGKSILLGSFVEEAAAAGAFVLRAGGFRAEKDRAMGVVQQLCHSAPEFGRRAEPVALRLRDRLCRGEQAESAHGAQELWAMALAAAGERPLVVAVDDVHLIDEESAEVLAFLARRIPSAQVLLVLTGTAPIRLPSSLHEQCLRLPYHQRLWVLPLSRTGTRRLIERRLGSPVSAEFAAFCYEATGGNPLLLGSLGGPSLTGTSAGPAEREAWDWGAAYREAVVSLVHRCGPGPLGVARGIAVLGASATPALVAELLKSDVVEVRQAVRELEAAGALESGRFRRPAALMAVREDMPTADLSRLNAHAARLLHRAGASATDVARRLADAGDAADPWARSLLRETARQHVAEDRADLAAEYLQLVSDALRGDVLCAEVLVELADAEWRMSPVLAKRHLPELAHALRTEQLHGEFRSRAVAHLRWHGRPVETAERLRSSAGPDEEEGSVRFSRFARGDRVGMPVKARTSVSWHRPLPGRGGSVQVGWPGVSSVNGGQGPLEPGTEVLLTALTGALGAETGERAQYVLDILALDDRNLESLCSALLALVYGERLDSAARSSGRLLRQAAARPHTAAWQALFAAVSAEVSLRQGALADAETRARTAVDLITLEGWGDYAGIPLSTAVTAVTAMGRLDDAAALLRWPVPDSFSSSLFGPSYRYARGRHHAATGGYRVALEDFLACGSQLDEWGFDAPGYLPWRAEAAEACVALGELDLARALIDEQMAHELLGRSRARGISLRVLASVSEPRLRAELLGEAVDILTKCGDRYELARALADLADVQGARGTPDPARTAARLATSIAKECHAEPLLLRTAAQGNGCGVPAVDGGREDGTALSEAERRVALLAANGHTNREISGRLLITVSTVEQHLTRVYRKLGVTGRMQLAKRLRPSGRTAGCPREALG